ncbi:MAG: agmatine deiminase family protein [Methanomicrobium sp.]|nr:agmatine deiminase family protein [Methanomicrobium sp.]
MVQGRLKLGLIQTDATDDLTFNLNKALSLAEEAILKGAKIVCLPELFKTPYFPRDEDINPEIYSETIPGISTDAFSALAKKYHAVIIVPVFERADNGLFYNSAVVINSDGELMPAYHKVHVPYDPHFYEKNYFYPGDFYHVYETTYAKIGVLICYDQWFSEPARIEALMGAEIIFYPTAIGRIEELLENNSDAAEGDWKSAWTTVQRGHAISNSVHVAAVNRIGKEGEIEFWGGSFVCDPFGNIIKEAGCGEEIIIAEVDLLKNKDIREGWGFLRNRRPQTYGIITNPVELQHLTEGYICPPKKRPDTPKKLGYHMPAEWESHDAVWLSWPYSEETFFDIESVEESYSQIISEISRSEKVRLFAVSEDEKERIFEKILKAGADPKNIDINVFDYSDVWFRDYGPLFVVNRKEKNAAIVDWIFDAWGGKYDELKKDSIIPSFIGKKLGLEVFTPGIVLEGGSIDVNGKGTLLTTRQCLLNKNRNPHLSKEEIEEYLDEYLGASNIIWLNEGIEGDDTDGHIDDIARFVNDDTVICAVEDDKTSDNYRILIENYEILKNSATEDNRPLNVIPVPMPGIIDPEIPLPASYTNFYIGNSVVLVPVFGTENDEKALEILRDVFPKRNVKGIDCRAMVYGLGTIHCISQQQPSP